MNPVYEYIQHVDLQFEIEKAISSKSKRVCLRDYNLAELPSELFKCVDVEILFLQRNKLKKVPTEIASLAKLWFLTLDNNCLVEFPKELLLLPELRALNLSNNPIGILPESVRELSGLDAIWINNCNLIGLPTSLRSCKSLRTIGARHNQIFKLPDTIIKLSNLSWLTLDDNKLDSLPKGFKSLSNLIHLNLNRNFFALIPPVLIKLKKLQYLFLECNRIAELHETTLENMKHLYKINLMGNPLENKLKGDEIIKFPNVVFTGIIYRPPEETTRDDNSDSSTDWEGSIDSCDIDLLNSSNESEYEVLDIDERRLEMFKIFSHILNC